MRRLPNPWIAVPSLVAGALAGTVAGIVTDVSCRYATPEGTIVRCPGWTATWALVAFLLVTIGMAVVLVLVFRSLAEHRQALTRGEDPPGPGCEV